VLIYSLFYSFFFFIDKNKAMENPVTREDLLSCFPSNVVDERNHPENCSNLHRYNWILVLQLVYYFLFWLIWNLLQALW